MELFSHFQCDVFHVSLFLCCSCCIECCPLDNWAICQTCCIWLPFIFCPLGESFRSGRILCAVWISTGDQSWVCNLEVYYPLCFRCVCGKKWKTYFARSGTEEKERAILFRKTSWMLPSRVLRDTREVS